MQHLSSAAGSPSLMEVEWLCPQGGDARRSRACMAACPASATVQRAQLYVFGHSTYYGNPQEVAESKVQSPMTSAKACVTSPEDAAWPYTPYDVTQWHRAHAGYWEVGSCQNISSSFQKISFISNLIQSWDQQIWGHSGLLQTSGFVWKQMGKKLLYFWSWARCIFLSGARK